MFKNLMNLFFPPKCPFCGEILEGTNPVCTECRKKLPFVRNTNSCRVCSVPLSGDVTNGLCKECRRKRRHFEHNFAPVIYSAFSKRAVTRFKYYRHPSYAKAFAFLLVEEILAYHGDISFDFVTYVPQNSKTRFARGYNQAELLAREIAKLLNLPCVGTLVRTNAGKRQATLNRAARLENVRKCYKNGRKQLSGKALLTDDVFTTGATASYCSYLLKKQGCDKVYTACAFIRSDDVYYEK